MPSRETTLIKRLNDTCASLSNELGIPTLIAILRKKDLDLNGSPKALEYARQSNKLLEAMKTDIDVLSDRSEDLVNNYEDKLKNSIPPHLEVEWPLMNQNQLRHFLVQCCMTMYWRN